MNKTAFIFGAGVSVGATASGEALPSQSALLGRLVALQSKLPEVIAAREIVIRYLKTMYPGGRTDMKMPFEEVIGPLEWLEAHESAFHIGGLEMRNMRTLAAFDTLLAYALNRPTHKGRKVANLKEGDLPDLVRRYDTFYACSSDSPNAYSVLLWKLLISKAQFLFVSFNYDLVLDRTLFHESSGTHINYHIPSILGGFYRGAGTSLIKPHGSLNWSWCTTCKWLTVFGTKAIFRGSVCPHCLLRPTGERAPADWPHGSLQPLLLRPSFMKTYDIATSVWNAILEVGADLLADCDEWIFVGYSFPSADYWVRAWLRLAASKAHRLVPNG